MQIHFLELESYVLSFNCRTISEGMDRSNSECEEDLYDGLCRLMDNGSYLTIIETMNKGCQLDQIIE